MKTKEKRENLAWKEILTIDQRQEVMIPPKRMGACFLLLLIRT